MEIDQRSRRRHELRPPDEELFVAPTGAPRPQTPWLAATRLRVVGLLAIALFALLVLRSAFLQIPRGGVYRTAAEENRIRLLVAYAPRGVMMDRWGKPLTENVPTTDLVAYPAQLPEDTEHVVAALLEVFPALTAPAIQERLLAIDRHSLKPIPLKENISHQELIGVLSRRDRLHGVEAESRATRAYVGEGAFAHVLGYTGRITQEEHEQRPEYLLTESVGKTGLEARYEQVLRGKNGARRTEVDALGNAKDDLGTVPTRPGANLRLHLDAGLQELLTRALRDRLREAGTVKGAAVAMDPRDGAIRALVSLPTFDHTALTRGLDAMEARALLSHPDEPLLNRASHGQYPPGSTFKIAVAAGALEEGVVNGGTRIESTGGIRVGPQFFPDWKPAGHGTTDLTKALAESVNTFFYVAGGGVGKQEGLGIARMMRWAQRLGFGQDTGIDLPDEAAGFLPSPEWKEREKKERWYIGDTYHAAIGQGDILVTPVQMAVATATIANGGTLYEPHIVSAVEGSDWSTSETIPPEKRATRVVHQASAERIREGMRASVVSGSSKGLLGTPVAVAAKTGTAQTSTPGVTHAWVTTFAPFETPELVLTILAENGGSGDVVAVPVARDVFAWVFGDQRTKTSAP